MSVARSAVRQLEADHDGPLVRPLEANQQRAVALLHRMEQSLPARAASAASCVATDAVNAMASAIGSGVAYGREMSGELNIEHRDADGSTTRMSMTLRARR